MKQLFTVLFLSLFVSCCATTRPTRTFQDVSIPELTNVNLDRYRPQRPSTSSQQDITAMINTESAARVGALAIPMYTQEQINTLTRSRVPLPANRVVGPWTGVCVNEPAINHIVTSTNEIVRRTQADDFQRLEALGANAVRDIQTLQGDLSLLRTAYQSRLRNRDIALEQADQQIVAAQRQNVLLTVGLTVGGLVVGAGTTALVALFSR